MTPLDLVRLTPLMDRTRGRADIVIGLIDGPVATGHPAFAGQRIREIPGALSGSCAPPGSVACLHGTFVAGILSARRGAAAPALCPDCTLLIRPIFGETISADDATPIATAEALAQAIVDCIEAGANVVNVSAGIARLSSRNDRVLDDALQHAARRAVIVIVASGNQGTLGSTAITRHPWVIPVVAFDLQGKPVAHSNLGTSIGRRGLGAPGDVITSLGVDEKPLTLGGSSAATPFVTGTVALLWSAFPTATANNVRSAVTHARSGRRRATVVPALLDAWGAWEHLRKTNDGS